MVSPTSIDQYQHKTRVHILSSSFRKALLLGIALWVIVTGEVIMRCAPQPFYTIARQAGMVVPQHCEKSPTQKVSASTEGDEKWQWGYHAPMAAGIAVLATNTWLWFQSDEEASLALPAVVTPSPDIRSALALPKAKPAEPMPIEDPLLFEREREGEGIKSDDIPTLSPSLSSEKKK